MFTATVSRHAPLTQSAICSRFTETVLIVMTIHTKSWRKGDQHWEIPRAFPDTLHHSKPRDYQSHAY